MYLLVSHDNNELFNGTNYRHGFNKYVVFDKLFNYHNDFILTDLNDIPLSEKYAVHLTVHHNMFDEYIQYDWMKWSANGCPRADNDNRILHKHFDMPTRVWNDSSNGLVHWIISWDTECDTDNVIDFDKLITGLNCNNNPGHIIFGTAGELSVPNHDADRIIKNHNINVIHCSESRYLFTKITDSLRDQMEEKYAKIIKKESHKYKSLCYNGLPRTHRLIILSHMEYTGAINDSLHSLNAQENYHINNLDPLMIEAPQLAYLKNKASELLPTVRYPQIEEQVEYNNGSSSFNNYFQISFEHTMESMFHVVTETFSRHTYDNGTNSCTFITEKSYKPFVLMQPMIIYGNAYTIEALRLKGFKMFDKWIDHSYDLIEDPVERMVIFLKELDRLNNIPHAVWSEMLIEMIDDLLYNAEHMTRHYDCIDEIRSILF